MTELDILKHAKSYIEQMAQGRDPLRGEPVPETDLICNGRISKCLSYVAGVLEKVIGQQQEQYLRQMGTPFALTEEQRREFVPSPEPVTITDLCRRISNLKTDPEMRGLTYAVVTDWMIRRGILEISRDNEGKNHRVPTQKGLKMGITTAQRVNTRGAYTAVFYSAAMQQYLVDHLPEILAKNEAPKAGLPEE